MTIARRTHNARTAESVRSRPLRSSERAHALTSPNQASKAAAQDPANSPAERRAVWLFALLAAGAAGMAVLLALLPAAGHDQLWFLIMGRRWLAGASLYGPEAFDSNPPAVVWLSAAPVWLGAVLHLPATFVAKLLVLLLEAGCAMLSFRLLPLVWRPIRRHDAVALLFAAVVLFGVVPARDFGQRDHLAGLLLLLYVLSTPVNSIRSPLRVLRLIAAALAAVAICLKPHYALVPLFIEAAVLLFPRLLRSGVQVDAAGISRIRRLLRPEPALIVLCGAGYLLAIRHWAPLYFASAVPISRGVYWAIGHLTLPQLLWQAVELCVLAALTLWLFARQRSPTPAVRLLLLAGTASFAAYLVQGTGWYYQQLPAISFFGAALALELLDQIGGALLRTPVGLPRVAAALVFLALFLTAHFTGYPFTQDRAFAIDSPDPSFFTWLRPGDSVAILTTSVDEAMMPVERYHLTWAQRTNNLWLLPAVLRSERPEGQPARRALQPERVQALDELQHRWMVEDLTRWRPRLVLIERCQEEAARCQVLEDRHDDLLAWFQRDPAFAGLWQHYTFAGSRGRFDAYTQRSPAR